MPCLSTLGLACSFWSKPINIQTTTNTCTRKLMWIFIMAQSHIYNFSSKWDSPNSADSLLGVSSPDSRRIHWRACSVLVASPFHCIHSLSPVLIPLPTRGNKERPSVYLWKKIWRGRSVGHGSGFWYYWTLFRRGTQCVRVIVNIATPLLFSFSLSSRQLPLWH